MGRSAALSAIFGTILSSAAMANNNVQPTQSSPADKCIEAAVGQKITNHMADATNPGVKVVLGFSFQQVLETCRHETGSVPVKYSDMTSLSVTVANLTIKLD